MGLDSHLSGRRSYWGNDRKIDEEGFYVEAVEVYLGYWRKDWPLQNYVTDNFGDGNEGTGPFNLELEQLHQILEAVPLIKYDTDYDESEEERLARIFDTEEMIKRAIVWLTIDTVVPPVTHGTVWRTVFWHASW